MSSHDKEKKIKEVVNMAVLTADCKRAFVVAPDKAKDFLSYSKDYTQKEMNKEILSKVNIKNKETDDRK